MSDTWLDLTISFEQLSASLLLTYLWRTEKTIFNTVFHYLIENNLLNSNQSDFMPGDWCVHQLMPVNHEIYVSVDTNPSVEGRGIFLDTYKAFYREWDFFLEKNVWVLVSE